MCIPAIVLTGKEGQAPGRAGAIRLQWPTLREGLVTKHSSRGLTCFLVPALFNLMRTR
jgi:hypothetical protein